jgi:hypothetical protein
MALEGGWGVCVTPRPLFTSGKDPAPIVQEAGWVPGPVWTGAENLAPTGIRSPDRSARSQSLYRLRYPAHRCVTLCTHYKTSSGSMTNPSVIPISKSFVYLSFHLCLYRRYSTTSQGTSTLVVTSTVQQNSIPPTDPLFLCTVSLTADGTAPAIQNILHSEAEEIRAQCIYPSANFGLQVVITLAIFCITVVLLSRKLGSKMARASQSMTGHVFPIH